MAGRMLLGMDIGTRSVKAVQLTEDPRGTVISAFGLEEIPDPSQKATAVTNLVRRIRAGGQRTVSNVSGRSVIVRHTPVNAANVQDLAGVVAVELPKYIPFEKDEVEHAFHVIPMEGTEAAPAEAGKGQEFRIVLVAAKKADIQTHIQLIRGAQLKTAIVDVDVFALGNAYEMVGAIDPKAYDAQQIVALIDVGASKTAISIQRGPVCFFTREFYIGGDDFSEAVAKKLGVEPKQAEEFKRNPGDQTDKVVEALSTAFDDLCHEINLSIDFFENQYDKKVDAFFLSGGGSLAQGLPEAIERTFDKAPTRWNPVENFPVAPTVNAEELKRSGPMLAVALGLASRIRN